MTHDEMIAVIQAHKEGKKIQCKARWRSNAEWSDLPSGPSWEFYSNDYRVKPEPKLRPWKPEEVPVGAQVRLKRTPIKRMLITKVDSDGMWNGTGYYTSHVILEEYEHSTDGGKTWLPCGVEEGQ